MEKIDSKEVQLYVERHIGEFHTKRIEGLNKLELGKVLKKKNPYLFKAKYVLTAHDIVKSLTDAFISSQEETIFGDWLEGLVIFINKKVYDGRKSSTPGIDLEFDNAGVRYIVNIKSGPNWGNSSQIAKMKDDFTKAMKTLRTSNSQIHIIAVNGCCYGRDDKPDKGTYFKYCGQRFWEFISGDAELYTKIIEPLGYEAREKNDDFAQSYANLINKFVKDFAHKFCDERGQINWEELVRFNSSTLKP